MKKIFQKRTKHVAGFLQLYLNVYHDRETVELTQLGLIGRIVFDMSLTDVTKVETPDKYGVLLRDEDGESCNTQFNYPSIVGIL